ncbi:MAG: flavodoxin family protein, partial [Planctomycetes bacterium]|nr:flavodoxin family protein [Planctomycetota bacterium]
MKVVTINGSAKPKGNTALALDRVSAVLNAQGIETERIEIGKDAMHGCIACGMCAQKRNRRCVFDDDLLNKVIDTMIEADGMVIGSPVHYAGIGGALKSFLDRAFFVASASGALFRHKIGAGVVAVRRGGEIAAFDQLNKYFTISEMFVPSSTYWNMVFGMAPGEAAGDGEGMQTMDILGQNMAWLLKARANGSAGLSSFVEK